MDRQDMTGECADEGSTRQMKVRQCKSSSTCKAGHRKDAKTRLLDRNRCTKFHQQ